jgi:transcription elongation factor
VQIKQPGRYRNDLGFVLDFDNRRMDVDVAIIPRIRLTSKRLGQPAASLFDPEQVKEFYGSESIQRRNQILVFKGSEFKNGLLERHLGFTDISHDSVNPTQFELSLFTQCSDPSIVDAAYQEMTRARVGDRIQVVAGDLQGVEGRIADIDERGTAVLELAAVSDRQAILIREIRKEFRLGDLVHVISGDHQGTEGFIVAMDTPFATLFCHPPGQNYCHGGQEVDL